jgi:hypothetical protein
MPKRGARQAPGQHQARALLEVGTALEQHQPEAGRHQRHEGHGARLRLADTVEPQAGEQPADPCQHQAALQQALDPADIALAYDVAEASPAWQQLAAPGIFRACWRASIPSRPGLSSMSMGRC